MAPINNKEVKANKKDSTAMYSYIDFLVEKYPELKDYATDIQDIINNSPTGKITYAEVAKLHTNTESSYFDFWNRFDSDQEASELLMAQDERDGTTLYADSIQPIKARLQASARTRGLNIDDATLTKLAEIARYENFTPEEIETSLRSESRIDISQDLTGTAGTFQAELETWSAKNGLQIPADVFESPCSDWCFWGSVY
jgi:hypothetical protein